MLIGYARISTDDQNLALQHDALTAAGCEKIYEDRISGVGAERPGLTLALEVARAGDTLIVWRLDRLGRSLKDLITLAERLEQRQVGLKSLKETLDTTSSGGRLIFHMFGALADYAGLGIMRSAAVATELWPMIGQRSTLHYSDPRWRSPA